MKHLHTFESFLNEATINEATAVDKVQPIAKEFLEAVKTEFKTEIEESQLVKMTPKGFEIRAVILSNDDKMYSWADAYTAKHKDDVSGVPLKFKVSPGVPGRKTLWPSNNKMYFDIDESLKEAASASGWSKAQLDKELKELAQGAKEAGDIDDSMAFDIADGWIADNPGVEVAIKRAYGVSDAQGFVANKIA